MRSRFLIHDPGSVSLTSLRCLCIQHCPCQRLWAPVALPFLDTSVTLAASALQELSILYPNGCDTGLAYRRLSVAVSRFRCFTRHTYPLRSRAGIRPALEHLPRGATEWRAMRVVGSDSRPTGYADERVLLRWTRSVQKTRPGETPEARMWSCFVCSRPQLRLSAASSSSGS